MKEAIVVIKIKRSGNPNGVDKYYRENFGDPTADDLRTVKALFDVSVSQMATILKKTERHMKRTLAGKSSFSTSSFRWLLHTLEQQDRNLSAFLWENGGKQWWKQTWNIGVDDQGRRVVQLLEKTA